MRRRIISTMVAALTAATVLTIAPAALAAGDSVVLIGGTAVIPGGLEDHLNECANDNVERFAGNDRYATAAAIADQMASPDVVFLATGENFPDAVAIGPVGALENAPVLLTRKSSLPGATRSALARLNPSLVVIVGGTAVISSGVQADVASTYPTTRVAGRDRYDTAAKLSAWQFSDPGVVNTVLIATGEDFLDALVAGPVATREGGPLLLSRRNDLPSQTRAEIIRLAPSKVIIVGATGIVSAAVEAQIEALGPTVDRISGSSRYTTAADAAAMAGPGGNVFVVTSHDFADGLAAVPLASGDPIVFAGSGGLPDATAAAVSQRIGKPCERWSPPYPQVGSGKRVIYTLSGHQLWMIDENENLVDTYLVTGRAGIPHPGTYKVFSKSVQAYAPYGGITMRHMVRFVRPGTWGNQWSYGFHSIPRYANGQPLQSADDMGRYGSGGCVRQPDPKAAAMYAWADIGTTVIVLP